MNGDLGPYGVWIAIAAMAVVAYAIRTSAAASLVMNANYGGSPVPVPEGVGSRSGRVRLLN